MPIENSRGSQKYGLNLFAPLMVLDGVTFIGKVKKPTTIDLMKMLVESTKKTWPLYVIALALAICAGSIVWVLVSKYFDFPEILTEVLSFQFSENDK